MISHARTDADPIIWHHSLLQFAARYRGAGITWRQQSHSALRALHIELVKATSPTTFIEAGACDATVSMEVAAILPGCRCIALEADPETYVRHVNRVASSRVEYVAKAACETDGPCLLYAPRWKACQNSRSLKTRNGKYSPETTSHDHTTIEVTGVRIDSLVEERNLPTERISLWIDCEGCGGEVVSGCEDILPKVQTIFLEHEDVDYWNGEMLSSQLFEMLLDKGFVPVARDFEYEYQYNVLWIARDHFFNPLTQRVLIEWNVAR